jgi:hypothetical protein
MHINVVIGGIGIVLVDMIGFGSLQVPRKKRNRESKIPFFQKKERGRDVSFFLASTNSPKNRRYRQPGTFSTYGESPTHDDEKKN